MRKRKAETSRHWAWAFAILTLVGLAAAYYIRQRMIWEEMVNFDPLAPR